MAKCFLNVHADVCAVVSAVTPEEALRLIKQGEGQTVEFKNSFAEENKAIQTLCAFANADGGTVFFGVRDDGGIAGVSLRANTRENFVNKLKAHTSPLLRPAIDPLTLDSQTVVAVTIQKAAKGELFAAFARYRIRLDKTNQDMSPDQVRARLLEGQTDWSEERDRPRFEVMQRSLIALEPAFQPTMIVRHVSGDQVAALEWRFRGSRFAMEWRHASGSALDRTNFSAKFDLSAPPQEDDQAGLNEMGFEIRFQWRGQWRHQLQRWPITRRQFPQKVLWDIGGEIPPPLYFDQPLEVSTIA